MDYFESAERQKLLKESLDSWMGTSFRHHCGVKGQGTDCIHFAAHVVREVGILAWHKNIIPNYSKDWFMHDTKELLKEGIERNFNVKRIRFLKMKNGDIILSNFGKASSHVGFYFDGYVYQALNKVGVCKIRFTNKSFRRRMKFAYRLLE